MAKKGAAKAAAKAEVKPPVSKGPGGLGPVTLENALASIADACGQLPDVTVVACLVRVLRVLCDAAGGDAAATPAVAAIRGGFAHLSEGSFLSVRVGDLKAVKAAIDAAAAPPSPPAPPADSPAVPPENAAGSDAAA